MSRWALRGCEAMWVGRRHALPAAIGLYRSIRPYPPDKLLATKLIVVVEAERPFYMLGCTAVRE
jgi:hypothetical protein